MRLWTVHPRYLDVRGLVALWREALLAQAVIAGKTRGYTHHPQLRRFRESASPLTAIAAYLRAVHAEAVGRGYQFDASKIGSAGQIGAMLATRGQLDYEWDHLKAKLRVRSPSWLAGQIFKSGPEPHPLFQVVAGGVAEWEVTHTKLPDLSATGHGATNP